MKLKPESREVDLYVQHGKLTKKEAKELGEFIEQVRQKNKLKKAKHRKAA